MPFCLISTGFLRVPVHAATWKRLFDQFLEERAAELGEVFVFCIADQDWFEWKMRT